MSRPHIQLLSRRDCCLCDDARVVVAAAAEKGLCSWQVVDVDKDKALLVKYGLDVPVLLLDGREIFRHRVNDAEFQACLTGVKV